MFSFYSDLFATIMHNIAVIFVFRLRNCMHNFFPIIILSTIYYNLGGTLMSLEEGTSFWSSSLMWKVFFCAAIAFPTYNAGKSVLNASHTSEFYNYNNRSILLQLQINNNVTYSMLS